MNRMIALIVCLLFMFALFVSALVLPAGNQNNHNQNQNLSSAFVIWGTQDYSDETYMGAEPELNASKQVCEEIFDVVLDSNEFS